MIDIEQLEREITAFHENVVASAELLATLRSIVDALTENTHALSKTGCSTGWNWCGCHTWNCKSDHLELL